MNVYDIGSYAISRFQGFVKYRLKNAESITKQELDNLFIEFEQRLKKRNALHKEKMSNKRQKTENSEEQLCHSVQKKMAL